MKIACTDGAVARQVIGVFIRHGITRSVHWEGGSPIDNRIWLAVNRRIDPSVETTIRCDIKSIAGATVHCQTARTPGEGLIAMYGDQIVFSDDAGRFAVYLADRNNKNERGSLIPPHTRYAIQVEWSDGHASGIYPFKRLRELG